MVAAGMSTPLNKGMAWALGLPELREHDHALLDRA